jgi:surface antigen
MEECTGESDMQTELHSRAQRAMTAIAVAAICSGLLACSGTEYGQKEAQGQEIGSIVGGMVAPYIGGGSAAGQFLQANAGTIGGLIGGAIGAALDEEDRLALERDTRAAFASGQTRSFSNRKTGVRATVKVTGTRVNAEGRQCRTVRQDVRLKDGTSLSDDVSACRGPNGNWDV